VHSRGYTLRSSEAVVFFAAVSYLLLASATASAQSLALDPQVRAHAGLNVVGGPSGIGFTGGLDSRLTNILALDIGGFASPIAIAADVAEPGENALQYSTLRHGIYVTPGLRIRHPQPKRWAWELFLRAGGGVIWTADLDPDSGAYEETRYAIRPAPAGLGGGDALVRFGRVGVRASAKVWMYEVVQNVPAETFFAARPQWSVEALVQW
jgi:hypothetical protein